MSEPDWDYKELLRRVLKVACAPRRNAGRVRWAVVSELTAHGHTRSIALCRELGIDPHEEVGANGRARTPTRRAPVRCDVKVGDRVHYHPVIGEPHDGKVYTVRATGDLQSGPVAWLEGKAGCVCLEALSPAEPAPAAGGGA